MNKMIRIGAYGAFVMASAYLVGLGLAFTLLDTTGLSDPIAIVEFHVQNYGLYYTWITFIYIVASIFLVPLSLALREKVRLTSGRSSSMADLGTVFAIIWATLIMGSGLLHNVGLGETVRIFQNDPAEAARFWKMIETVHSGIGASIEIPGGLWTILISSAALSAGVFPKALNIFAIIIGAFGIISIIPPLLDIAVPIYALGQIVWWIFLGIFLLKKEK